MAKRLNDDEWHAVVPPFVWVDLRISTEVELQILTKWIEQQTSGWFYYSKVFDAKYTFVFEEKADMVAIKLWLSSDPFNEEHGEIN